ncbi:hypothetical protein [Streptococcus varani]|jgi:hypothetical protein|nr:hypothetical protein [Streptococcus varani]
MFLNQTQVDTTCSKIYLATGGETFRRLTQYFPNLGPLLILKISGV